jgi:hypothetical protein
MDVQRQNWHPHPDDKESDKDRTHDWQQGS